MLTICYDDMPQLGFNDIEGTYVSFLQLTVLAESLPSLPKKVTNFVVSKTAHLP